MKHLSRGVDYAIRAVGVCIIASLLVIYMGLSAPVFALAALTHRTKGEER